MYVGVDIGGTKTLLAVLDDHGVITEKIKFPTPPIYEDFLLELDNTVDKLTTKDFRAGGIAAPGKIDREHGVGLTFGNLKWRNVHILQDTERILGCPLVLDNDANLAGLSEAMLLKDRYDKVLYVTISTGIGVGIIGNRTINPMFADSEGGQMLLEYKGKLMPWEKFASGHAIVERYGKMASEINDAATWKRITHDIARGMIELIALVQPEVIVIGGSVGTHFPKYHKLLEAELKKYETPLVGIPELRQAARPEEAVIFGCYDLAKSVFNPEQTK